MKKLFSIILGALVVAVLIFLLFNLDEAVKVADSLTKKEEEQIPYEEDIDPEEFNEELTDDENDEEEKEDDELNEEEKIINE